MIDAISHHKPCIARHKQSGMEKSFDNVVDRNEYITSDIRSAWEFFFRSPNGYEYGKE